MAQDVLKTVFGISAPQFRERFGQPLLRHGAVARFDRLLARARPRDEAGIAALIDDYTNLIETMRFDRRGVLRRLDVRGSGIGKLLARPERCHFFYDYDRQYRQVRLVLQDLRTALDAKKQGANCLGALHTAGALVPRHCDDVDVIVLQVMGTRLWRVEPNSDPSQGLLDPVRWPRRLAGGWSAEFGAKSRTYALAPGSAFYVPRGWWHETQSPATSFALTFAFKRKRGPR